MKPFDSKNFKCSRNSEPQLRKLRKSGFFWNDKESRFSLTAKQRFENTNSRLTMTDEVFKS